MPGRLSVRRRAVVALAVSFGLVIAACTPIMRASVASTGTQGNGTSWDPSLSSDGHYVAFDSSATNLVPGDTNGVSDVFVRDTKTNAITRVSVTSSGVQGDNESLVPRIDGDGGLVAFISDAQNLNPGYGRAVDVHDMQTDVTTQIMGSDLFDLDFTPNGRYLADVWLGNVQIYDRTTNTTETITGPAAQPSISDDGRYVVYTKPRPSGSGNATDIFVTDRVAGTTTQVPFPPNGSGDASYQSGADPQISGNGRYIAYDERELTVDGPPGDQQFSFRAYVYDMQTATLARADVASDGTPAPGTNAKVQAISDDGRDVMFTTADQLVPDDVNGGDDEYVRDMAAAKSYLVDRNVNEQIANNYSGYSADISGDGTRVAFSSQATNLVNNDTNGQIDVFVRNFPGAPAPIPSSTSTTLPPVPHIGLEPACTSAEPYAVDLSISNFPVEEIRINLTITYADKSTYKNGFWFTPNSSGAALFPDIVPNATQPYELDFNAFIDTNHDGIQQNENTVESGFIAITDPCASAVR